MPVAGTKRRNSGIKTEQDVSSSRKKQHKKTTTKKQLISLSFNDDEDEDEAFKIEGVDEETEEDLGMIVPGRLLNKQEYILEKSWNKKNKSMDDDDDESKDTVIRMRSAFTNRKKVDDGVTTKTVTTTISGGLYDDQRSGEDDKEAGDAVNSDVISDKDDNKDEPMAVSEKESRTLELLLNFQTKLKDRRVSNEESDSLLTNPKELVAETSTKDVVVEEEGIDGLSDEEDDFDFLNHKFGE